MFVDYDKRNEMIRIAKNLSFRTGQEQFDDDKGAFFYKVEAIIPSTELCHACPKWHGNLKLIVELH